MEEIIRTELIKKYQWAGKIRFLTFLLLFFFLLALQWAGISTYLNPLFVALILVEACVNQPYSFFLKRVNLYRFQFYQMLTDILVISWILYHLGGLRAPVVSIAYYVVILWAGVVSGTLAVFFAVSASAFFFSLVVLLEHLGILPRVSSVQSPLPLEQMLSLLLGNVAFLFAFAYFSLRSSQTLKLLERRREIENSKHTHRFLTVGYLLSGVTHDIINHLVGIRGYAQLLLEKIRRGSFGDKELDNTQALKRIEELESESMDILTRLSRFAQAKKREIESADINRIVEDALLLTLPLARASNVAVEKTLAMNLPWLKINKTQIQEAFVILILQVLEHMQDNGKLTIKTNYNKDGQYIEIALSDTRGIRPAYPESIRSPIFTTSTIERDLEVGLSIVEEVINQHSGKLHIESLAQHKGMAIKITLPVIA